MDADETRSDGLFNCKGHGPDDQGSVDSQEIASRALSYG
jgi:hypothetical protein